MENHKAPSQFSPNNTKFTIFYEYFWWNTKRWQNPTSIKYLYPLILEDRMYYSINILLFYHVWFSVRNCHCPITCSCVIPQKNSEHFSYPLFRALKYQHTFIKVILEEENTHKMKSKRNHYTVKKVRIHKFFNSCQTIGFINICTLEKVGP